VVGVSSIRALGWTSEGELSTVDRLDLLVTLLETSIPEVRYELVCAVEALALREREVSFQVTVS
jgi:hypothetical protein